MNNINNMAMNNINMGNNMYNMIIKNMNNNMQNNANTMPINNMNSMNKNNLNTMHNFNMMNNIPMNMNNIPINYMNINNLNNINNVHQNFTMNNNSNQQNLINDNNNSENINEMMILNKINRNPGPINFKARPQEIFPRINEKIIADCFENINDKINVTFDSASGLKIVLPTPGNVSFKQLIRNYLNRLGLSEDLLKFHIRFIFNGQFMDVNDQTPISSLLRHPTISVIETQWAVGARYF
jgi:hypothetical protein